MRRRDRQRRLTPAHLREQLPREEELPTRAPAVPNDTRLMVEVEADNARAVSGTPPVNVQVLSVFDVRPINARDFLYSGRATLNQAV